MKKVIDWKYGPFADPCDGGSKSDKAIREITDKAAKDRQAKDDRRDARRGR